MKYLLNLFLIIISGIFLMSLSKCNNGEKPYYNNLYLIDVNDKEIFNDARIKGAINLSFDEVKNKAKSFNKGFKLIFYCTDYFCAESSRVAKAFYDLGFTNLFVYKGGIQEWYQLSLKDNEKYSFEGSANSKFLKMAIEEPKVENTIGGHIKVINAQDLSKLLKANINNGAA